MAGSEIDDIFASKGKLIPQSLGSSSTLPAKKIKTKKKKRKRETDDEEEPIRKANLAPETVVDSSTRITSAKRIKVRNSASDRTTKAAKTGHNEERFLDSRGARSRRKTDEGWTIYKEDELGIGDEGGDTSLCPFDCNCCF